MKLRIKGDSLRLRLTQGDVAELLDKGRLIEKMNLVDGSFTYQLLACTTVAKLSARMEAANLCVSIPDEQMRSWAKSDQVSLRNQHGVLQILVEKDFACLQPREGEDDGDAYPHPGLSHG